MSKELLVPDIGDFENVEIIELLVKEGDQININDPVITIESDKSSVEIPSTVSGLIESIKVKVGDKVSKGDLILNLASLENNKSDQKVINGKQSDEKIIPKDTEKLIVEAEQALKNKKIEEKPKEIIRKEKPRIIQVGSQNDIDPIETNEWLDSLSEVIKRDDGQRAHYLIKELMNKAYMEGVNIPYSQTTPYINTIPVHEEVQSPGDQNLERKIRSLIRWNAAAMVVRANKRHPELGGHIGTFASAATLYDVGMNHFWREKMKILVEI